MAAAHMAATGALAVGTAVGMVTLYRGLRDLGHEMDNRFDRIIDKLDKLIDELENLEKV